jgi:hypothetical protein
MPARPIWSCSPAPFDVVLADDTDLQPDLVVTACSDLDPDPVPLVLELVGHRYVETARVVGDQAVGSDHPYPLTVVPRALVR